MEKIVFFGNSEIARYWLKEVASYLDSKGIDYKASWKFFEIDVGTIRIVFKSIYDEDMVGRRNVEIVYGNFEKDFEGTIAKLLGGKN